MTALFALATSLLWGLADFGGGLLTRRTPALTVVVVSQSIAVVVLGALVVATGGWSEAGPQLWFAVAAGLVGPVAMLAFYKALALGPMGVVSPLGSIGVAVPVGVGLMLGERPGLLQLAGILVAVAGVCLAGGPQFRGAPVQRQAIALTLLAAFGFGAVMALIAEASTTLTGLFLALFVQRVTNVAAGGLALFVSVRRGGPALPADGFPWRTLPALAFVGLADVAANGTYSIAAQHGPVTVAAVLASLYPVVTAVAARGVLRERLRAVQAAGAGLALVGTVLLASG
ncbi:EamA family transporter [Streptomyces collinus]|jgi:drug/metabolite transporter (DMT)-like permease|uniref:Drug/metabolite transporter (DMT)-like permease n=2 Tax=Streptomyces TaxID=1883 RepID=A0AA89TDW7_STRCU|nr:MULTISPECIES: DMT family transporter [Streptomyces]MBB5809546.1 drug/metabolite transporter (DMT)-like permease [Streptomyces collinus]MEC7052511.1 DMT family transporter [Streptomyces violaceochromogenes]WMX62884.1 DMT family transporter [Streptomyces collinus]GHC79609.1 membrane protein [Streptomyces violaceochromogenes]